MCRVRGRECPRGTEQARKTKTETLTGSPQEAGGSRNMRAHGHRIFIRLGERAGDRRADEIGRQRKYQRVLRPL